MCGWMVKGGKWYWQAMGEEEVVNFVKEVFKLREWTKTNLSSSRNNMVLAEAAIASAPPSPSVFLERLPG
jgi:hypothetical protein